MDIISTFLALMVTLSMATERVTEAIKGFPVLSSLLAKEKKTGSWQEEARQAAIHIIAIAVGTGFAYGVHGPITSALKLAQPIANPWGLSLLLGGLASGGSAIWNNALDIVRLAKQQKAAVFEQAKKAAGGG